MAKIALVIYDSRYDMMQAIKENLIKTVNKKINYRSRESSSEVTSTDRKGVTVYKTKLGDIVVKRRKCVVLTVSYRQA